MKFTRHFQLFLAVFLFPTLLFGAAESFAQQGPYDGIVVFGGSLSDTGNAFFILSHPSDFGFDETCGPATPQNVPPYDQLDELFIPDGSYARGGHHVTNGATWVEDLARGQGLSGFTRPALGNEGLKARNYAVGGARANDYPCRFNLMDQMEAYLGDFAESSPDTLFLFEMGGNDLRDILAGEADITAIATAIGSIQQTIVALYQQGARQFLLANVPNFGQAPAVQMIDHDYPGAATAANVLALVFNGGLAALASGLESSLPGASVQILDLYNLFDDMLAHPGNYGLQVTNAPCVTPGVPPFTCKKPDTYLFWDGLHPTRAVHEIMAQTAAETLSSP